LKKGDAKVNLITLLLCPVETLFVSSVTTSRVQIKLISTLNQAKIMMISAKKCLKELSNSLIIFLLLYILINALLVYYEIEKKLNHPKPTPKASDLLQNPFNVSILKPNDFTHLIDLHNFYFKLNNFPCRKNNSLNGDIEDIFVMIIVHSAPTNYQKRKFIRKTWGSRSVISNFQMRLVFLLGSGFSQDDEHKLLQEDQKYNDIIIGNFKDTYRNLTYKHIMGLKWISYYCQNAKFVLKTDDDIFIDTFQLIAYIKAYLFNGIPPKRYLICFLNHSPRPKRIEGSKWKVVYEVS